MDRRRRPGVRFADDDGAAAGPPPRPSSASSSPATATPSPTSTLSTSSSAASAASATARKQMAELDRLKRRIRRDASDFFAVGGGNGEADGFATASYGDGEWRLEPRPVDFQGPKAAPTASSPFRASAVYLLVADGGGYAAGDLTVTVRSRPTPRVTVSGRREIHAAGRASTRRFRDDFDQLPAEADATAAAAWLRSDGRVLVLLPGRRPGFEYRPLGVTHLP